MRAIFLFAGILLQVANPAFAGANSDPWQIGSVLTYRMMNSSGTKGTMQTFVREYEGANVWTEQIVELDDGTKHRLEILLNPTDGNMVRLIQDGQERPILDHGDIEIVEERPMIIDVPAGHFSANYRRMRHRENGWEREAWTSTELPMNGLVKMIGPTELGPMTFELIQFVDGNKEL